MTNGTQTVTLVTNTYDGQTPSSPNGTPRQWDAGAAQMGYATTVVRPGSERMLRYDRTGAVVEAWDWHGHSVGVEQTSATNFAAPSAVTPNSDTSLRTTMAWNGFLGLTQETGPNGAQASITYDNYARPSQTVSPHGAVTTYVYTNLPPTTKATTNGRWVKTTFDGFGLAVKVERGDGSSTTSVVETEYESCACAALGKVKRVSQPYAPGGTVYWTVYTYDALGRTVSVAHPGGSGTTSYAYAGNTVTVTDAAGKWKKYWMDALGNLVQVTEPNPGGGSNYETYYSYNVLDRLVQAQMTRGSVTQTRSWVYNVDQRLQSETHPESGTTSYTYNGYGAVTSKQPANSSIVSYGYDGYGRLTTVTDSWNVCQNMTYVYGVGTDGGNVVGRVKQVTWGDAGHASCWENPFYYKQSYTYTAGGLVTNKTVSLRTLSGTEAGLPLNYSYDNEGRVTTITGPDNYTARYTYDTMGRVNWVGGYWWETFVTDVRYGAADEVTRASYLLMGVAEERTYNARGQLTRIQAPGYVDLEYQYSATANNGQITQMKNWRSGEEVSYTYDALSRLVSAATTGPEWGLTFGYDGFGNKLSQTVTKGQAPMMSVVVNGNNRILDHTYDAAGNTVAMPGFGLSYDAQARVSVAATGTQREVYGYGPDNLRVYVNRNGVRYVHLRGVEGKLMGIYRVDVQGNGTIVYVMQRTFTWFGGRDVTKWEDRLGSVQTGGRYYPYGEEYPATGNDNQKFATYWRDMTGLDYAMNRYYASTVGRFVTPNPYGGSGKAGRPGSWNRYAYVEGDPVNAFDPSGLSCVTTGPEGLSFGTCYEEVGTEYVGPGAPASGQTGGSSIQNQNRSRAMAQLPAATNLLDKALNEGSCRQLFGEGIDPQKLLRDITTGPHRYGNIEYAYNPPEPGESPDAAEISGNGNRVFNALAGGYRSVTITINTWLNPDVAPGEAVTWNNGNVGANAVILAHELLHAFELLRGAGGIRIQGGHEAFNKELMEKCSALGYAEGQHGPATPK